jgi:hypothetical protein
MADPRAFISFDFDHDDEARMLLVGQSKNSKTPFNIQDWSAKEAMPQDEWKVLVEDKIKRCHMVIVLVGKYMKSATGVAQEIKMAKNNDVPYFGIYVNGADQFSNLPDGLERYRTITWTWAGIEAKVAQMLNEGKNRKGWF